MGLPSNASCNVTELSSAKCKQPHSTKSHQYRGVSGCAMNSAHLSMSDATLGLGIIWDFPRVSKALQLHGTCLPLHG